MSVECQMLSHEHETHPHWLVLKGHPEAILFDSTEVCADRKLMQIKGLKVYSNSQVQTRGGETELRMRINLNFTEAIMATEEDASITDLAGKLS